MDPVEGEARLRSRGRAPLPEPNMRRGDLSTDASDEWLVHEVRRGRRDAFQTLVLRYERRIFTLALRLTGSRFDAEDLAQETFLRAYQGIASFRFESRLSTWLYQICRNLCLNHLPRRKRAPGVVERVELEAPPSIGPREELAAREWSEAVRRGLRRLRPELREVIVLYGTHSLSYEEIAHLLELPIGTVRSRLHRGREALKDICRAELGED